MKADDSSGMGGGSICFEDDHLLVINKPAGMNTHSPSPYAGQGIYEWLRDREPRWARLAIIHRLDKETSGLMVFTKTAAANRAVGAQFATRAVQKKYVLATDRVVNKREFTASSFMVRTGDKYCSRPKAAGGQYAETRFRVLDRQERFTTIEAEPKTGRTHQIRVHAAENGFPLLGDTLYGGAPAKRLFLHAAVLSFKHPASSRELSFEAAPNFEADPRQVLRDALIDPSETNAYRLIHGAADGWPDSYIDRLGDFILAQSTAKSVPEDQRLLQIASGEADAAARRPYHGRGAYYKMLTRDVRQAAASEVCPTHIWGETAPERFNVRENGLVFELSFEEGYSVGLFLDQRENRRRFLLNYIAPEFAPFADASQAHILNAFAYTCGFSLCAAKAGAKTTSIDLSRKYLDWGRRNFEQNSIALAGHDFIYGDVFEWLRRMANKQRVFDVIVLDPPTSSHSKAGGFFTAEKDYPKLVRAALPLLKKGGVLLACTNASRLKPETFIQGLRSAVKSAGRTIRQQHYVPQPPDFPITREEPAYLKTVWLRVG